MCTQVRAYCVFLEAAHRLGYFAGRNLHPLYNFATNDVFWSILLLGAPVLAPQVASPGVAFGCYLLRTGSLMLMAIGLAPALDASHVTSLSLWGVPFMQIASCLCSPRQPQFQAQVLLHILDSFAAYSLLRRTGMGVLQALLQCCMLWCTLLGANYLALSIVKRSTPPSRKHAGMQSKCSKDESISAEGPSPYCTTPPPSPVSVTSVGLLGSANQTKSGMASLLCQGISMVDRLTGRRLVVRCFGAHKGSVLQAEEMGAHLAQGALGTAPTERGGTPPPQQPQQQGAQSPAAAGVGCVTCIEAACAGTHGGTVWGRLCGGACVGGSGGGVCVCRGPETGPDAWFGGAPCAHLPCVGSSCSAVYVGGTWSRGELPLPVGDSPQWQALFAACVAQPPSNHIPCTDSEDWACGKKAARTQQVGRAVAAIAPAPASASAPAQPRPLASLTRLLANATIPLFLDSVTPAVAEARLPASSLPPPPPRTQTHRHHHHHHHLQSQPQPHTVATVTLTLRITHPSGHPITVYKGSASGKPERVPRPAVWCPPAASSGRGRGLRGPLVGAHVGGEVPPAMAAVRCGKAYLTARVVGSKDSVFAGRSCCRRSEDGCGGGGGGRGDGSFLWTGVTRGGASSGNADALGVAGEAAPIPMNVTRVFLEISVPPTLRASRPVLVELWAGSVLIGVRPVYLLLRPPVPASGLTPLPPTQQQRPQPRQPVAAAPKGDHLLMCAQAEVQELAGLAAVHHPASVAALIHDFGALCELLDATEAASETLAKDMAGWQAVGLQSTLYDPATQARSAAHVQDSAARSAAAHALVTSLSRCTVCLGLRATSQRLLTMCGASEAGRALLGPVHWLVATPGQASALTAAAAASGSAGMVRDIAWWLATHAEGSAPASVPTPTATATAASAAIPAPMATLDVRRVGRQTGEPGASPNIDTPRTAAAACEVTTIRDRGHDPPSPALPHHKPRDGVRAAQDLPDMTAEPVPETFHSQWRPLKAWVVGFRHPEMERAYSASLAASMSPLTAIHVFLPSMVWVCAVAWRYRPGQPEPDIVLVATLLCLLLPLHALCAWLWWLGWSRGSSWLMELSFLAHGLPTTVLVALQLWWSHTAGRPLALVADIVNRLDLVTAHPLPSLVVMGIPTVVLAPMRLHAAACNMAIKGATVVAVLAASGGGGGGGGGGVGVVAARVVPWVLACWGPACVWDVVRRCLFVKGWVAGQAPAAHKAQAHRSTAYAQTHAHSCTSSQSPGMLCGAHRNAPLPPGGRRF